MTFRPSIVHPAEPDAAEKQRQKRVRMPKPASMVQCRCGSREMIEAKTGVLLRDGKTTGGTKVLLCALCLINGKRVVCA